MVRRQVWCWRFRPVHPGLTTAAPAGPPTSASTADSSPKAPKREVLHRRSQPLRRRTFRSAEAAHPSRPGYLAIGELTPTSAVRYHDGVKIKISAAARKS